ncbi:MAG: DUF4115 domain-containing protein [Pseudanabaenaceae cyanobacterium SKYGB_i_bin29]|nr:DUF4115 domain-containing protein [Pseudanabaenaceae cyanobacterium SKYG29]MDW8421606.1 DUF4115 domain-containing protein [Pseudanabaenaceae cyanobacterium SKYGB_i_bin29]
MTNQVELAAKLAEIGAQLRQVREAKDLTLEQLQAETLISKRHLQAIEEGNLDHLPELVYVQGFIRKYGQAVGIVDIADEFPPAVTPVEDLPQGRPELRPWHLYALYVALVVTSISLLAVFFQEPLPRRARTSPPVTETKSQPQTLSPPVSPANALAPVNVKVEMQGESWLRVTADGNVLFEGILTEGTSQTWTAAQQLNLRVGNAAAVRLQFNQAPPQVLGAEGEVVEVVFDRKGIRPQP